MSAINTGVNTEAIRSEIWQPMLEEILTETLTSVPFVRMLDFFGDGSTATLVSMGQPLVRNLSECQDVTPDGIDTGEIQIDLDEPIVSANALSWVFLEDSFLSSDIMTELPIQQAQAIMEVYESRILALANTQSGGTGNPNNINGIAHRRIASGTGEVINSSDYAYARYALKKAKVPDTNLMAVVDPSVAYALETQTQLVNVSNNPRWEGIIADGISENMRFIRNVGGFDVWESNLLANANETIGLDQTTAGKANIFMSAARETLLPFVASWRRRPVMKRVEDTDKQEDRIITTARFGKKLTREDNLVVILSDTDQVT